MSAASCAKSDDRRFPVDVGLGLHGALHRKSIVCELLFWSCFLKINLQDKVLGDWAHSRKPC